MSKPTPKVIPRKPSARPVGRAKVPRAGTKLFAKRVKFVPRRAVKKTAGGTADPSVYGTDASGNPLNSSNGQTPDENAVFVDVGPGGNNTYAWAGQISAYDGSFVALEPATFLVVNGQQTTGQGQPPSGLVLGELYRLNGTTVGEDLGPYDNTDASGRAPAPPQYAPPQYAPPQYAPPQYAPPQYAPPQYAPPQYAPPQYAPPQYAPPQYAQVPYGYDPSTGLPYFQPQYAQPQYAQPQYAQPQYAQPQYAPGYDPNAAALYAGAAFGAQQAMSQQVQQGGGGMDELMALLGGGGEDQAFDFGY